MLLRRALCSRCDYYDQAFFHSIGDTLQNDIPSESTVQHGVVAFVARLWVYKWRWVTSNDVNRLVAAVQLCS